MSSVESVLSTIQMSLQTGSEQTGCDTSVAE